MFSRKLISLLAALVLASPVAASADEDPHAKHRAMMKQKSEPAVELAGSFLTNCPKGPD